MLEYNKSRYRLISLSFESTFFHFCSVDPRDSQFLEEGTTPASVSVYSASRYATRSYCIINSNLLTSFQPWISERIYPYISTYISQRNSPFFTSSITSISNAVCRSSLLIVIDVFVYYVCS